MNEEKEKKKGLFARLREGLSKTRGNMTEKVDDMVRENRKIDEDFYEELEDILLMADCGLKATTEITDELRARVKAGKVKDAAEARDQAGTWLSPWSGLWSRSWSRSSRA